MSTNNTLPTVSLFRYVTDSESGWLEAVDFMNAINQLRAMLPHAVVENGGWGWVSDDDGYRYSINCD